jgi:MarR family transcriptional regulator, transcriptional regulator for hemolysin
MALNQDFFSQFYALYRPVINNVNGYLAKYNLYSSQWRIMKLIKNEGPLTAGEIATRQCVEKPTVTQTIKRLFDLGLIEVIPGKDKREKMVRFTTLGLEVYEDIKLSIDQLYEKALEGIHDDEKLEAIRILGIVTENLRK